jgi:acetyl-CoA synthetase
VLLDDELQPAVKGEVYLRGPSIGLSTRLLNRDHHATYFEGAPLDNEKRRLRRHGDELESLGDGRYRVGGRTDDTMNLGGIKVGCVEIERVVNQLPQIHETAAVAVSPVDGGPSQLIVFAVLKAGVAVDHVTLRAEMQKAIREQLNPLFRVEDVRVVASLPRTASNKVMRRELRASFRAL